jgi:hypothetical protein
MCYDFLFFVQSLFNDSKIDSDVQNEINRIKSFSPNLEELAANEPLVVYDLVKKYEKHKTILTAVDHLSFGVNKNECFGY